MTLRADPEAATRLRSLATVAGAFLLTMLDRPDALALLGLIGVGTIVGRFALAAMADAIGRRPVFLLCCGGMAASMLLWAGGADRLTFQAFALGFGALQGGFVALLPAFAADVFGPRAVGRMLGVLYTSRGVALLAGPPALATLTVVMAGHGAPLAAFALMGLLGTALVAAARPVIDANPPKALESLIKNEPPEHPRIIASSRVNWVRSRGRDLGADPRTTASCALRLTGVREFRPEVAAACPVAPSPSPSPSPSRILLPVARTSVYRSAPSAPRAAVLGKWLHIARRCRFRDVGS